MDYFLHCCTLRNKKIDVKGLLRQLGAGQECLGGKRNVPALGLFMQNWEKSLKQCCSTFCCCFFVGFGVFQCCPAAPWRGKMPSSGLQGNSQAGFHLCSSWIQLWSDENPQPKKKKKSFLQPDCAESSTQGVGQVQEELRELWKSLWSSSELRSPCWRRDRTEDLGNPCGVWEGRSRKWKRICDLSQP